MNLVETSVRTLHFSRHGIFFALFVVACSTSASAQEQPISNFTKTKAVTARKAMAVPTGQNATRERAFRLNEEGVALIFEGKRAEGTAKIAEAMRLDPKNTTVLYNAAGLYLADGKAREAVKIMQRAVALEPNDTAFINRLAEAHFANSDIQNAVKTYEQLVAIEEGFDQALLRLGTLYGMLQEWEKAETTLRRARKLEGDNERILNNLATILVARGKHSETISMLSKSPHTKKNAEMALTLALSYEAIGQKQNALRHFKSAKELGSADPNLEAKISELSAAASN